MKKIALLIGILCAMTHLTCNAAEWEKIITEGKETTYVDTDSFSQTDNKPSLIIKTVNASSPKQAIHFARYEFNCAQHLYRVVGNGSTPSKNERIAFKAIPANSKAQQIESLTCQIHRMVGGT